MSHRFDVEGEGIALIQMRHRLANGKWVEEIFVASAPNATEMKRSLGRIRDVMHEVGFWRVSPMSNTLPSQGEDR